MNKFFSMGLVLALFATATSADVVSNATGTVSVVGKQMNVPIEGQFRKFSAQIQFDPAKPAAGKAVVEIDMTSLDFGEEDFNNEMRTKTWFDAKTHPKATFVSSAIKPSGTDRFDITGKLTIKGKAVDLTLPATVKTERASRVFEGSFPIKRTAFNIGEGEWKDTSLVADDVQVRFRLSTAIK